MSPCEDQTTAKTTDNIRPQTRFECAFDRDSGQVISVTPLNEIPEELYGHIGAIGREAWLTLGHIEPQHKWSAIAKAVIGEYEILRRRSSVEHAASVGGPTISIGYERPTTHDRRSR